MSGSFSFGEFTIRQDRTPMKVGTDGVLLGGWAQGGSRILDIGTGTGVIALLMAQRFPAACVVGVDLDEEACREAVENVACSPFAERVRIVCSSIQEYGMERGERREERGERCGEGVFDAIVSNPPFFERSLKNPDGRKAMARHTYTLSFDDLFRAVARLLSSDGVFSLIVPVSLVERVCSIAYFSGFYISRKYAVKTTPEKPAKRCLLAFQRCRPSTFDQGEVVLKIKNEE